MVFVQKIGTFLHFELMQNGLRKSFCEVLESKHGFKKAPKFAFFQWFFPSKN